MQPCVFSKQKYLNRKVGWHRGGYSISYQRNDKELVNVETRAFDKALEANKAQGLQYELHTGRNEVEESKGCESPTVVKRQTYTLTFMYTFEYDNDSVFFSHFYPYTLADLE